MNCQAVDEGNRQCQRTKGHKGWHHYKKGDVDAQWNYDAKQKEDEQT